MKSAFQRTDPKKHHWGFAQRKGARLKWRPWTRWFVPNARARRDGGWPWSKWSRMMNGVGEMYGCEERWKITVMQKRERERSRYIQHFFWIQRSARMYINKQSNWMSTKVSKVQLCERFSIQTMRPNSAFLGFQGQTSMTMSQGLPYASYALWF